MKALIVDDSATTRSVLENSLTDLGFSVSTAETAEDGLESIDGDLPDVIFLDWHLPGMDGIDFLEQLREDNPGKKPRVLMVTREREIDKVEKALNSGADEFLMKPFTTSMIQEKLEDIGVSPDGA